LFYPPERSLAARSLEASLVGRRMRLVRFGEPDLEVEFLPGHQFGSGRGATLQNWYVGDGEEGSELVLRDTDQNTYRLSHQTDGRWSGGRLIAPQTEALLVPAANMVRTPDTVQAPHNDGLIADLVAASGLAASWTQQAETELLAALRLIDRASPGVADRLRSFCALRCTQNDRLRQCLQGIASQLSTQSPVPRPVVRSVEVLRQRYTQAWRPR
jgi:hypothetical protein